MNTQKKANFFIFAGEHSGDLHGSELIKSLRMNNSLQASITGVGGPKMRQEGLSCLLQMEDFQVMGFSDVLLALPKLWKQFKIVRNHILNTQPDAVVLIDYPGFNLRLADSLRKNHYKGKIIQYICPTVWAWGKKRIPQMAKNLDLLLVIYPFETECFSKTSLKTQYIGNPLAELIHSYQYHPHWMEELKIPATDELIAIFPGSREGEIKRNLTKQLQAAESLKKGNQRVIFALSVAHEELLPLIKKMIKKTTFHLNRNLFLIPKKYSYELMRSCRTAIAKSGTVTLELALHHKPTVVVYELSSLNRFIAKHILRLKLPHYCIVNILLNQTVFPELIADQFSESTLYQQLKSLNTPGIHRDTCITACQAIDHVLKKSSPGQEAVLAIERLLQ